MSYKILITGTAGFIGHHLAKRLVSEGHQVFGLDMINDYYDIELKFNRLRNQGFAFDDDIPVNREITSATGAKFIRMQLEDKKAVMDYFEKNKFEVVINLAAQAGVRYSLTHPEAYIDSNISGFLNVLEACRFHPVKHLIYASSSSVYGLNTEQPFSTAHHVDHPISLYAASKKSNELMAHVYSHLFGVPTTGLRFFTVYGPWGRPDMALFIFTKAIMEGRTMQVFNNGEMSRDFTYIEDIVESIFRLIPLAPEKNDEVSNLQNAAASTAPYRVFNIGSHSPVRLLDFVDLIEQYTGKKAEKDFQPIQAGDVPSTYADVESLFKITGYKPKWKVEAGVREFVNWYKAYYNKA